MKKPKDSESSIGSEQSKALKQAIRNKNKKIFQKRNELKIVIDTKDVTPQILKPLSTYNPLRSDRLSQSYVDTRRSLATADGLFSTLASAAVLQSHMQTLAVSYSMASSATPSFVASNIIKTHDEFTTSNMLEDDDIMCRDSAENIDDTKDKVTPVVEKFTMPTRITITLTETPVVYLLEMPSISAEIGTEEGEQVEKDNEYYDYLTIGKGRNRKTTNAEIQTIDSLLKTRYTYAENYKKRNNHAFASAWDMLDTYENKVTTTTNLLKQKTSMATLLDPNDPKHDKLLEEMKHQIDSLVKNTEFQNAVTIMERMLANNVFNLEQKRFRGLIEQDPFRPDIAFRYRLELLWTFKNATTEGHPVTSMHWNPSNKDILAVGYGKFLYADSNNGFVYCWNIKNPTQPEREFYPNKAVTAVRFSTFNPNLLAVGLYDGMVHLLDIANRNVVIVSSTSPSWSPSHEPVWQCCWLAPDDYHPEIEHLVCVTEDGRVSRLVHAKTNELIPAPLMRILPIEGKLKGVYQPRHCPVTDVPISKCSAALVLTKHSVDRDLYYVGTDEGTIHRCSRNYLNQHIDMFLAHNGPVYGCEFSPFWERLFLTCGADWCTTIWAENITQPLITLSKSMETVEDAAWCPANSTIIANISGNDIFLWDIQRRTYLPASCHKSPTNCRNTLIKFTDSGRNLVVADIEGNVHIFTLEDMPFPPFYQAEMLMQVIKKSLITRTDLITQLESFR